MMDIKDSFKYMLKNVNAKFIRVYYCLPLTSKA